MFSVQEIEGSPTIPEFYAGKSVFITGATGFLGKTLIEKICRSCPDVREVFLLLRPKKGKTIEERLLEMLKSPLFDRVAKENPTFVEKLVPITGDVNEEGLGLSPVERQILIERVSIVFHVAANVKFDDTLKSAVFVNLRSTRDMCILASSMKNLVAFVHVSSIYAHSDKPVVEETVYPPITSWKKMITVAENVDDMTLRILTAKYMNGMANTYIFTKRLAEDVISDYSNHLPCVIFRPSIVVSTYNEPIPGWIDNFNGPAGLMIGGGKGILRVLYGGPNKHNDYVPVDLTIRAMIIASWKRGVQTITKDPTVHVYNCASSELKTVTMAEVVQRSLTHVDEYPMQSFVWRPRVHIVENQVQYFILMILFHMLPALVLDFILKISGKKPMLTRLQRKVYVANRTVAFFVLNEWKFRTKYFRDLLENLLPQYADDFSFNYERDFDDTVYLHDSLMGGKKYLLHEDPEDVEDPRRRLQRAIWIDRICRFTFYGFILWTLHRWGIFLSIWRMLTSIMDGSILGPI